MMISYQDLSPLGTRNQIEAVDQAFQEMFYSTRRQRDSSASRIEFISYTCTFRNDNAVKTDAISSA
jgi:hypothetical protein